jgi:DsbC/DsbD-like thiol-disulfide interchange protein
MTAFRFAHRIAVLAPIFFACAAGFAAQDAGQNARQVVHPTAYISANPVPRGGSLELAVVALIATGFHVNANKTSDDFLIPTTIDAQLPAGLRSVQTIYPAGKLKNLSFSDKPVNVYDGAVTLFMKLQVAPDAPLGEMQVPVTIRYQACSDTTCLPPVKLPVTVSLTVGAAGTKSRPQHPQIFARQ